MSWRLVQKGQPPLVVAYLMGPGADADHDGRGDTDESVMAALPGAAIVETAEAPLQGGDLAAARKLAGLAADAPVVLCGYSAGCQSVRAHLIAGLKPAAVVTIDGTSGAVPLAKWQRDVWTTLLAEAEVGERTWVATCTLQRYTETLANPFAATSNVLAEVFDAAALRAVRASAKPLANYPGEPVYEHHAGSAHLLAYGSTNCDKAAHIAQATRVFPKLLAEYISGLYPASAAVIETVPHWRDSSFSLGERCALWCLAEMDAGVHEEPAGSNTSPRIREYLAPAYRRATGQLLGLKAGAWCVVAQCMAQRECLAPGEAGAHGYYASGVELEESARTVGTWRTPQDVRDGRWQPMRGDLAVLPRTGSDPAKAGWERHGVRVLDAPPLGGGAWRSIGGNEGDRWQITARQTGNEVGWIEYPRKN